MNKTNIKHLLVQNALYLVLFTLLVVIVWKEPSFLSVGNFTNILSQSSVRTIIALGVAGLIVTQGTDLSAGRQVGMAALIAATLLQRTDAATKVFKSVGEIPTILVILLVVAIGAFVGLINGIIISCFHVTPFIATLGMTIIVYGANSLYFDAIGGQPVSSFALKYSELTQGVFMIGSHRVPYLIFYALIAVAVMWVLWNKTVFGKNIFAIGGNPEAAAVSGVNVKANLIKVYALSGMFYALGGFLEAGRVGSATNNIGNMYELDAIAACVVGGVSFFNNRGTHYCCSKDDRRNY